MISLWIALTGGAVAVLQSTWLSGISIAGAQPDLVLLVLTYSATTVGVQRGQITGFIVGFIEDGVSVAPPGFFAVVRLVHSAVIGLTRGMVSGDVVIMPVVLVAGAFLLKTTMVLIVSAILGMDEVISGVFSSITIVEGLITIALAPLSFWLMRRVFDRFVRRNW